MWQRCVNKLGSILVTIVFCVVKLDIGEASVRMVKKTAVAVQERRC